MNEDHSLFPFPLLVRRERFDGCLATWSDRCNICSNRQCETKDQKPVPSVCPFGYHFLRVDPDTVIASIIINGMPILSQSQKNLRKKEINRLIPKTYFENAVRVLQSISQIRKESIDAEKARIIEEYKRKELFKADFLQSVRENILRGLAFVHDYKQISTQISQHINVIIESRYLGNGFEYKLEKANDDEKAIYWASKLLEEKLNVARFLIDTSWLTRREDCSAFRFHGLVHKYVKIYESLSRAKALNVIVEGSSFQNVIANGKATAIIPHTFIDNAIKYSPKGSKIEILLQDLEEGILFSITSLGPRILPAESERIFEPFFRGEKAIKQEEEGSGYGLYVSQQVAVEHLGSHITVNQISKHESKDAFKTTFSILIPLKASIL